MNLFFRFFKRTPVVVFAGAVFLTLSSFVSGLPATNERNAAFAQSQAPSEAEAFEAAKALGTTEAWNAFVANYPAGFRADLARAYLKQLADKAASPSASTQQGQTATPEQPAFEQSCSEQRNLRSREANAPAKLRFINPTDGTYVLQWIDYNGALKEYGTLGPGAEITQDTFLTHPWIVAYGEGSCRQIFLPAEGISVARVRTESELSKKKAVPPPPVAKKPVSEPPPLKCAENYRKVGNECVMMQNCGSNARRGPEGDCYCNSGYHMMNGQCTRPRQQPNQCGQGEVYSSSMGQCIPKSLGR
ncbi:MAG: hypothetical protein K2X60_13585 [Xanthobacteraceae bacterium]|nr:hypothetical protein [Xanthobacteraceae bacterium]